MGIIQHCYAFGFLETYQLLTYWRFKGTVAVAGEGSAALHFVPDWDWPRERVRRPLPPRPRWRRSPRTSGCTRCCRRPRWWQCTSPADVSSFIRPWLLVGFSRFPETIPLVRCGAFLLHFCCSFRWLKESTTAILQFYYLKSAAKLLCLKAPLSCCSFKAQNAARMHCT